MVRLFGGLRPFNRAAALGDALAGVTLALMNIPQVLGYARIAGMPIVTGLYTVLLPPILFAVFGSSRHLVVAADSATAAILFGALSQMAGAGSAKFMMLAQMVALLTAGLLLVARLFKLGFLADFLSRTVLVGFLAGVGLQVGTAMLGDMLGIAVQTHSTLGEVRTIVSSLDRLNGPTAALSALIAGSIIAGRFVAPRLPVSLLAVMATTAASAAFDFPGHGIAVIGTVPSGLPLLAIPDVSFAETLALLPVAVSCLVVIIAQSAATSRVFAVRAHEQVDSDADILGLAAANAVAAVSGAFVVNGSPTQTAMAEQAGGRSQITQMVFAAMVLVVLVFLTGPLRFMPRCTLAAIVFTIAARMPDSRALREIWRESRGEFYLAIATAAAVVGLGVEQGILLAIALSMLRHVRHSYQPHNMVLLTGPDGRWVPTPAAPGLMSEPGVVIYRFAADLFYANVSRFADEIRGLAAAAPGRLRWIIIEAGAITDIDYSAARSMHDLLDELARAEICISFARVSPYLRADMDRHRITAAIGAARIFPTLHEAIALARDNAPQTRPGMPA